VTKTTGSFAGLLEVEKTEDIPVPQPVPLSHRATDRFQNRLACRSKSRPPRRHPEKSISTPAPPQLGDAPFRTCNRSEDHSGSARSCRFGSNNHLPPPLSTSFAGCK